ncbi:MAG TPA: hypothetical protein VF412_03475 [Bdellovibrio sp.]|uniref:hypothetical protein n=1 Tax=Bdellovibrio sp. TaxID=28201 RepID=UPI002F0227D0
MKFYVCSILTTAALALPAFAAPSHATAADPQEQDQMTLAFSEGTLFNPLQTPSACSTLNLDDTQKNSLKEAYYNFAKQKNTLEAEVKNAMLDVRHTLLNTSSTKDDANASLAAAKTAMGNLGDAVGSLTTTIFYDILKPEQRQPALECAMAWAKMKKEQKLRQICASLPPQPQPSPSPSPAP